MPDNWTFVAAAYAVAALAFGGYWRWLGNKEREITTLTARHDKSEAARIDRANRSRQPSGTGHPRPEATSRHPLQQ